MLRLLSLEFQLVIVLLSNFNIFLAQECGVLKSHKGFTAGGVEASKGEAPWKAVLFLKKEDAYLCGGVLINNDTVITAAHCLQEKGSSFKRSDDNFRVFLGAHNLYEKEDERIERNVSYSIIHDDWNPHETKFTGDIAALKLVEPVNFTDFIQPICLPDKLKDKNLVKNANIGFVYGWGTNESESLQSKPYKVEIPINDIENCTLHNPFISNIIWNKSFCAGKKGTGVCVGDSGSGLYVQIENIYYFRGIVSSGRDQTCGQTTEAVFSDIIEYEDFIHNAMDSEKLTFQLSLYKRIYANNYVLNINKLPQNYKGGPIIEIFDNLNGTKFSDNTRYCKLLNNNNRKFYPDIFECIGIEHFILQFREVPVFVNKRIIFEIILSENSSNFVDFKSGLIQSRIRKLDALEVRGYDDKGKSSVDLRRKHFLHFSGVEKVDLRHFKILDVSNDLLFDLINVEEFEIYTIDFSPKIDISRFFQKSKDLKKLTINNCQPIKIPEKPMLNKKIVELNLNENNITEITDEFFQSLKNVREIYLKKNQISFIGLKVFSGCSELETLDLSYNQIEEIKRGTFVNNKKLSKIDLYSNMLKKIDQKFERVESLFQLDLRKNPCYNKELFGKENIAAESDIIRKLCKEVVDYD